MDFDNFTSNLRKLGKLSAIVIVLIIMCFTTLPCAVMNSYDIQTDSSDTPVIEPLPPHCFYI